MIGCFAGCQTIGKLSRSGRICGAYNLSRRWCRHAGSSWALQERCSRKKNEIGGTRLLSVYGGGSKDGKAGSDSKSKSPHISQAPPPPPKNVTVNTLYQKKLQGNPITMVTACDFPSAVHCDIAGIDVVLIGDSVGMVELGQV